MSLIDLKDTLRQYDFPMCAKEALIRIDQLLIMREVPSKMQLDVTMDVIAEFIFYETVDSRGGRRGSGMTPLQELQLAEVLCDYLSSCVNEITKNTVFLSLFGGLVGSRRLKILSILVSTAMSESITPVLLAVGMWLQQMGCSSAQSLQLAENIIQDQFYLKTSKQAVFEALYDTAPQFVSNFITAVSELYMHDSQANKKLPPKNLLEIITSWVCTNPTLCISAQLNLAVLPSGVIPMAAATPLAGLIRWCALASLLVEEDIEMAEVTIPMKKIKLDIEAERHASIMEQVTPQPMSEADLYLKLHLGILHSLRAARRTQGPPTAVNAEDLAAVFPAVQAYAQRVLKNGGKLATDEKLQNCLDRLGQAVQVALANGCVYGNISNLLASLNTLPENRLLRIIIQTQHQM